jgi:hypothetical protein
MKEFLPKTKRGITEYIHNRQGKLEPSRSSGCKLFEKD